MDVFLIGGGRDEAGVLASHRPFAAAVSARGAPPVAFCSTRARTPIPAAGPPRWPPRARRAPGRSSSRPRARRCPPDGGAPLEVCSEEAGEDLDLVQPRPGLGLVPFAVDVHATQWGTLTRLVHAVALGLVAEGVAIDEGTCVEVPAGTGELRVHGAGSAYRVQRGAGGVTVTPLQSGHRPAL